MDTEGKPFVTFVNSKYPWYTWRRHRNHSYHTEIDTKISIRILARVRKIVFFRVKFVYTQVDFLKRKKRQKIIDKEFLCFHGTILESHPVFIVTNLRVKATVFKSSQWKIKGKLYYWFTEGDSTGACYFGIHYCFQSTQKMETSENTWRKENRRRYKSVIWSDIWNVSYIIAHVKSVIIANQDMSKDNKS